MDGELNNLNTNNVKITFVNSPDNVKQSDELSADYLYYRKMGTAYSTGKKVKRAVIGISITVTATGVALGISSFSNAFVTPPKLANITVVSNDANSINYSFKLEENKNKYVVVFTLKNVLEEEIYKTNAQELKSYSGSVTGLKADTTYKYVISYTNNVDLSKELLNGQVTTLSK